MDRPAVGQDGPSSPDAPSSLGEMGYAALGVAGGVATLFIALETLLVGLLPVALGAVYVGRRAGHHLWAFVGGLMIGMALCAVPTLGPALTNNDPAVRYSSSTIPLFIAAMAVGAIGIVTVLAGAVRARIQTTGGAGRGGPE